MDLGALRDLVRDVNFDVHGVTAIVALPGEVPVTTTGIWTSALIEDPPIGRNYNRREPRRVMALRRDVFTEVPRGTSVSASERPGGASRDWKVDGLESTEQDHFRVILIPDTAV